MPNIQAQSGRLFATSAGAVLAFIIDEDERLLMLAHPQRPRRWEVVNGALEANETLLEAALRETAEEAGTSVQVQPLTVLHAYTFPYDRQVTTMHSVAFLMAYRGGEVLPGDDMTGSNVRWFTLEELESGEHTIIVPSQMPWIFRRAIQFYRLLKDTPTVVLQPEFDDNTKNKYARE